MVERSIIEKTFNNIIIKCSKSTLQNRINNIPISERRELLDDKLNIREKEDYNMLMELYETLEDKSQNLQQGSLNYNRTMKRLDAVKKRLFPYDKRIFEDYVLKKPTSIPDEIMIAEKILNNEYEIDEFNGNGQLILQNKQIESQKDLNFTDNELNSVDKHINEGYIYVNGNIYNLEFWKELNVDEKTEWRSKLPSIKSGIDSAIEKSHGLTQDTILYHGGYWDISLEEGEHFTWKGYTSLSYRENVARSFMMGKHNIYDADSWLVVAYTPTGKKGLAVEDKRFNNVANENEYLIGRGSGGYVYEYDNKNHVVYVVLDKD